MYRVHELRRAQADIRSIAHWLAQRSPQGAQAWLEAYGEVLSRLEQQAASCGAAPEHKDCDEDVRQAFFKTRRGKIYRVLFLIETQNVYLLRVRGPGQAPVQPGEHGV